MTGERVAVRLSTGALVIVDSTVREFVQAMAVATKFGDVIEALRPDGKERYINPRQVVYFEAAS